MRQSLTLCLFLSFTSLFAQPFIDADPAPPFVEAEEPAVAFSDIDGDGDLDVLIIGGFDIFGMDDVAILYTNDGNGNFTEVTDTSLIGVFEGAIEFVDVDGDNDEDLIIEGINTNATTQLFFNDGNGNFTLAPNTPFTQVFDGDIAAADVDGDNDQDLIISGMVSTNIEPLGRTELYINDGNGNFTLAVNTPFKFEMADRIAWGYVNDDNFIDLAITGFGTDTTDFNGFSALYFNDGLGNFTLDTSTVLRKLESGEVAFADVDGDEDEDLLLTGEDALGNSPLYIYLNDGNGELTETSPPELAAFGISEGSVDFFDCNLDGAPDLFITGVNTDLVEISGLLLNDGMGNFTEVADQPFIGVDDGDVGIGDVDGDEVPDILIAGLREDGIFTTPFTGLYINQFVPTSLDLDNPLVSIGLFPNPVQYDWVYLQFGNGICTPTPIFVYDTQGRLIFEQEIGYLDAGAPFPLDVSRLPTGVYHLRVEGMTSHLLLTRL
ncbi:MAG: FG-GAP-like repeat-containing protein [Bacteroidota bacterium]